MGLLYSSYASNDDVFYYKNLEHKGIKTLTEKTCDKWEVISFFDEKGYLLREINIYKKEIQSDYKYIYAVADTLLEIKRIDIVSKDVNKRERIDRYYYTSSGRCYKFRMFFSEPDNPYHFEDNFVYENGMLVSYTKGKEGKTKIVRKYDEKKRKIQEIEIRDKTDTTFYSYVYNQSEQLTDYIQESNNDEVIYSDVPPWSNKKMNKVHIRYSNIDKRGNWTKSYFITERGKVFRSERKIEYW